jgi:competence protein ComEC
MEVTRVERYARPPRQLLVEFYGHALDWQGVVAGRQMPLMLRCNVHQGDLDGMVFPGSLVRVRGVLFPPAGALEASFSLRNGSLLAVLERGRIQWYERWRLALLERMLRALEAQAPSGRPYAGYLQSMLTGDKRFLDYRERQQLSSAGVMHFFAISGFHLSVVAALMYHMLLFMRAGVSASRLGMLLICAGYVWLTGSPVSAQRAWLMIAVYFAGYIFQRKPDALAACALAALLILLVEPNQLLNPGFQLSFVVVIGLLTQALPLFQLFERMKWLQADPLWGPESRWLVVVRSACRTLLGGFAVSWTAFWLSAPIVAATFGAVPMASIILNTLLAPLFALSMVAGFISAVAGMCGLLSISGFLNHAVWLVFAVVEAVIHQGTRLPLSMAVEMPGWLAAVVVLASLGVGLVFNLHRRDRIAWLSAPPLIVGSALLISALLSTG